jgi:hypothetical protein
VIASFSSGGPTPLSTQMKPDVTAPGVDIVSSVPPSEGTWSTLSGTSMASPHVAGAVAVLKQRHPTWRVAQIKSALEQTAVAATTDTTRRAEAPTTREGGGFVNLPRADAPLLFASPTGLSFGLVKPGAAPLARTVELADAGNGAGAWTTSIVEQQTHDPAVTIAAGPATVPGPLTVTATVGAGAVAREHTGFVVLTRGTDARRIPYWFLVETPRLGAPAATLTRPGAYKGDTRRGKRRVAVYRYPDDPAGIGLRTGAAGPEQVFRVRISRPVANFGVVVTAGGVSPRIVAAGDENRLAGYTALPLDLNPYRDSWGATRLAAAAILPAPGSYDVVFDEAGAGRAFAFRYWVDDVTPPAVKLLGRTTGSRRTLTAQVSDAGSGVDPAGIRATIGKTNLGLRLRGNLLTIEVPSAIPAGAQTLVLTVPDYQETKNTEDVAKILPNTRTVTATVTVR